VSLTHELDRPFGYSSRGLPTLDYLAQGEGRDHCDRVAEEVVLHLASGEDYSVDQLLDLGVTCLGFREHLTDKIDRPLDW